jgi:hypothetical protein
MANTQFFRVALFVKIFFKLFFSWSRLNDLHEASVWYNICRLLTTYVKFSNLPETEISSTKQEDRDGLRSLNQYL